ncbi:MAG: hypothetical protein LQ347_000550 [Umbilicaria vellea]|nr:MAG: hypothetical protein LQ347_000550 [Umbilicaria vellea]
MAPTRPRRSDLENRLKLILDFAASLLNNLRDRDIHHSLTTDLYSHLDDIPVGRSAAVANKFRDVDNYGTELWNLSAQLKRDGSATAELVCLGIHTVSAVREGLSSPLQFEYLRVCSSIVHKVPKKALNEGQFALAERVVEKAASYEELLNNTSNESNPTNETALIGLSREYFIVRITVAWRQNRLDIAELMLSKLTPNNNVLDPVSAECLADVLFEIGKDQHVKKQYLEAVRWLEKADDVLVGQSLENVSSEASDLKTSIMHALVKVLMNLPEQDNNERAWNIVNKLDNEAGDKLLVLLLKLDLLAADENSPTINYSEALERVIRTVHLTESNFRTVMHHVHKMKSRNADMAFHILETLLLERLAVADSSEWVERALVTAIWVATTSAGVTGGLESLERLFESLHVKLDRSLGETATHAGQTVCAYNNATM